MPQFVADPDNDMTVDGVAGAARARVLGVVGNDTDGGGTKTERIGGQKPI